MLVLALLVSSHIVANIVVNQLRWDIVLPTAARVVAASPRVPPLVAARHIIIVIAVVASQIVRVIHALFTQILPKGLYPRP